MPKKYKEFGMTAKRIKPASSYRTLKMRIQELTLQCHGKADSFSCRVYEIA